MADPDRTRSAATGDSGSQPTLVGPPAGEARTLVTAAPASNATAATAITNDRTDPTRVASAGSLAADPGKSLESLVGRTIGGCTIEKLLGRGGMGAVFLAQQLSLHRSVALKVMLPDRGGDPQFAERFVREARLVAALNHPNVVQVFDASRDADGMLAMVMEFVPGRTLGQLIRDQGALPPPVALALIRQAADGLAAAHAKKLVHRDIKPDNLMVNGDARLKVMDFGLARANEGGGDNQLTMSGMILGTPNYLSPEGARGEPTDIRSDLYSLGVTMWQAIAGRLPFTGPTPVQVMVQHLEATPPDLALAAPQCPPAVATLVMRLLNKDAATRYPDPAALSHAIDAVERELYGAPVRLVWQGSTLTTPAVALVATEPSAGGQTGLVLGGLAALLALGVWGIWALWPQATPAAQVAAASAAVAPSAAAPAPAPTATALPDALQADPVVANVPVVVALASPAAPATSAPVPPTTAANAQSPGPTAAALAPPNPVPAAVGPTPSAVVVPTPPVAQVGPATALPAIASAPVAVVTPAPAAAPAASVEAPVAPPQLISRLPAQLSVSTIPAGAEVYVDGVLRGRSPLMVKELSAGVHLVRLVKTGYMDMSEQVVLIGGQVVRVANPLPKPASLELSGLPAGAAVTIGGAPYRAGMLVPSGPLELVVRAAEGTERRSVITAHPGSNTYALP